MALFGKNKGGSGSDESGNGKDASGEQQPTGGFSPEKAKTFFQHAKTNHDTSNYPYAMQLWLNGLGHDPSDMDALDGFVRAANAYLTEGGKRSEKSSIAKGLGGKGAVLKYQKALLEWGFKREDAALSVGVVEAAADVGIEEVAQKIGMWAIGRASEEKKPRKDLFVKLLDAGEKAGAFKMAVEAGDRARKVDPSDGNLDRRVKEMMAQAAIAGGGFSDTSQGGFRKNIRDAEKQTQLESADAISKTEDVKDRLVAEAEEMYAARPQDIPTIERLGRVLLERGSMDDMKRAYRVFEQAFKETEQFRFRQRAGESKTRLMKRQIQLAKVKLQKKPDPALEKKIAAAEQQLREHQTTELELMVKNYPTDLPLKFELGKMYANAERHEEAIPLFQIAEEDSKHRRGVLKAKAESFLAIGGFEEEAVSSFRQALDGIPDETSDTALELKYGLLCALHDRAKTARELDAATEAEKLASQISLKKFGYKDVNERRAELKELIGELKA
ncbi:MAG: tetratricopeptide repeat protein [Planctomycetota bacterium]